MTKAERIRIQKKILNAIGPQKFEMPSEPISSKEYHLKLHPLQIETATNAFVSSLLIAGSTPTPVGQIDLYELLDKYLLLPDFRKAVNALIREYPLLRKHIKTSIKML